MEVTLEITQFCDNNCPWCSSNASVDGKHLPVETIRDFLSGLDLLTIERINISGGEPLAHPEFYRVLRMCRAVTPNVWVYTNALQKIIFNSYVISGIEVEANVVVVPGEECYIPENVSRVHLLKLIHQGRARNIEPANITVSRNFYEPEACDTCTHLLLQADGKVVKAPCVKEYDN